MRRVKLHTEVRRDQIAEATLAVAARHGLKALSVAAVARRVGLAPSALYRHFRNKDEMLDAVLERLRDRLHGNIAAARAETSDPLDALHRLLGRHMQLIREYQAPPRVVFSDDFYVGHPERRDHVLQVLTGYLDGVADIIRQGQRERRIRRDVDARSLATLFLGMIQPAGMLWVLSDGRFDVTRQAREAWPVFEQAIRAGRPRRARRTARRS